MTASPNTVVRYVDIRGSRHRVQLLGPGRTDAPRLLLLHEGLGSIPQWRSFPAALVGATGLDAIVYERRNHGGSDLLPSPRGREYHTEEAEVLDELLDVLGVGRIVSYGHSDGATIALLHAARHPTRVAAVVSEAGHVITQEVARAGIVAAQRRFHDEGLREALVRHHGDKTDAMFTAWSETWLRPEFADWSVVDQLAPITAPVLVLQGERDEYATPDHVHWIADAVGGPSDGWVLPNIGHAPHREASADVVARVVEFLRTHGVI